MSHWVEMAASLLTHSGAERCPTCQHVQTAGFWFLVGFLGQAVFTARFLTQWVASERRRESIVPVAFWWLSLGGGFLLLAYAIRREDPVIIVGQALGVLVYGRNLALVGRARKRSHREREKEPAGRLRGTHTAAPRPKSRTSVQSGVLSASPSGSAMEPTLKRLRFDQDHAPNTPPSSFQPLFARLRARNDAL